VGTATHWGRLPEKFEEVIESGDSPTRGPEASGNCSKVARGYRNVARLGSSDPVLPGRRAYRRTRLNGSGARSV